VQRPFPALGLSFCRKRPPGRAYSGLLPPLIQQHWGYTGIKLTGPALADVLLAPLLSFRQMFPSMEP